MHSENSKRASAQSVGAQKTCAVHGPYAGLIERLALQVSLHLELAESVSSRWPVSEGQNARFHTCRVRPHRNGAPSREPGCGMTALTWPFHGFRVPWASRHFVTNADIQNQRTAGHRANIAFSIGMGPSCDAQRGHQAPWASLADEWTCEKADLVDNVGF